MKTSERYKKEQQRVRAWKKAYDLEKPDVDKTASNAWLKASEHFPETTGLMIASLDQVPSTNNYKKYVLKDAFIIYDTC
jgi:hypothetical protein